MKKYYLGIDQGTTGVTVALFTKEWKIAGKGYCELKQYYPEPGWVEHDPEDLLSAVKTAVKSAMSLAGASSDEIICLGLDHEGESIVLWDKTTGKPVYNAIVWQDRRTAQDADNIGRAYNPIIREKTGLMADSYFSALKIRWILANVPEAQSLLSQGKLLAGNMDAWIIWNISGGKLHVTDASTASRTMMFNIHEGKWDEDILKILEIPVSILPEICDSAKVFGKTEPSSFMGLSVPICGVLNDQQAALLGQNCIKPGMVKTTYGTGCFMLMNTGDKPIYSENGILTTVALQLNGKRVYALDGGIYISGAATQWLRDGLKIINSASETEEMAIRAGSNGGVYFVPAFTGLAAPYWDSYARGMMIGLTAGASREHIVRATLESTAYQVYDLLKCMEKDSKTEISVMRCDGGSTANNFLMQFQSDILGIPLNIPEISETTVLGSAFIAAMGIGAYKTLDELSDEWRIAKSFEPKMSDDQRMSLISDWHRAVERAKSWIIE